MGLKKIFFIAAASLFLNANVSGQQKQAEEVSPYSVNFKYEVPATLIGFGVTQYLYSKLPAAAALEPGEALLLNKNNVNRFDRAVFDFPASGYARAHDNSNYVMYSTFALPGLLLLDKEVRRDWKEVYTLYLQVHAASSALYLSSSFPIRRARPLAYNSDYPIELRSGESTHNSFFSGHTNSTAAATFFTAKVLCDYNDLSIGQKALIYTAAAVPPAIVARYRMRAGKHFRTDVLAGFVFGAATGILVPELHKKRKNKSLSYMPYYSNQQLGFVLNYKL